MNKGVVIGIIIVTIIISTVFAYSAIDQNSNNVDEIISSAPIPETSGVNHSIELSEGLTMTSPSP